MKLKYIKASAKVAEQAVPLVMAVVSDEDYPVHKEEDILKVCEVLTELMKEHTYITYLKRREFTDAVADKVPGFAGISEKFFNLFDDTAVISSNAHTSDYAKVVNFILERPELSTEEKISAYINLYGVEKRKGAGILKFIGVSAVAFAVFLFAKTKKKK